jgi:ABC-type transporter Mla MlaB component
MGEILLTSRLEGDRLEVAAGGAWIAANASELEPLVDRIAGEAPQARTASIDMAGVSAIDTFGAWLLERLTREWTAQGCEAAIVGLPKHDRVLLEEMHVVNREPVRARAPENRIVSGLASVGRAGAGLARDFMLFADMLGALGVAAARVITRPREFRLTSTVHQFDRVTLSQRSRHVSVDTRPRIKVSGIIDRKIGNLQDRKRTARHSRALDDIDRHKIPKWTERRSFESLHGPHARWSGDLCLRLNQARRCLPVGRFRRIHGNPRSGVVLVQNPSVDRFITEKPAGNVAMVRRMRVGPCPMIDRRSQRLSVTGGSPIYRIESDILKIQISVHLGKNQGKISGESFESRERESFINGGQDKSVQSLVKSFHGVERRKPTDAVVLAKRVDFIPQGLAATNMNEPKSWMPLHGQSDRSVQGEGIFLMTVSRHCAEDDCVARNAKLGTNLLASCSGRRAESRTVDSIRDRNLPLSW